MSAARNEMLAEGGGDDGTDTASVLSAASTVSGRLNINSPWRRSGASSAGAFIRGRTMSMDDVSSPDSATPTLGRAPSGRRRTSPSRRLKQATREAGDSGASTTPPSMHPRLRHKHSHVVTRARVSQRIVDKTVGGGGGGEAAGGDEAP